MPENWKSYKLTDLGTIARGKSKHRPRDAAHLYGGEYPFIQTGDVKAANHRLNTHRQTYTEAGLAQSKLWPKDTMCITIAANIAETAILEYPACFPDSIIGFIANSEISDIDFVEYLMQYFKKQIQSHSIGSVQDNINLATFQRVEFLVPPLPEQKAIANILSALDDKIENNLAINKTLEDMAMALYKHWFVDFGPFQEGKFIDSELGLIPEGWEVATLDKLLVLQRGFDLPKRKRVEGKFPVFAASGRSTTHNEKKVNGPGITTGRSGVLGKVYFIHEDFWPLNTSLWVKKYPNSSPWHSYFLLKSLDLKEFNSGSAVPTLNRNDVHRLNLIKPPKAIITNFDLTVKPYFDLQQNIFEENQNFAKLRDTLLPKLISGEVRVKDVEQLVSETL